MSSNCINKISALSLLLLLFISLFFFNGHRENILGEIATFEGGGSSPPGVILPPSDIWQSVVIRDGIIWVEM